MIQSIISSCAVAADEGPSCLVILRSEPTYTYLPARPGLLQLCLSPLTTIRLGYAADRIRLPCLPIIGCRPPHGVPPRRRCRLSQSPSLQQQKLACVRPARARPNCCMHADVPDPGERKHRNFLYARADDAYPGRLKRVCSGSIPSIDARTVRLAVGEEAGWEWGPILLLLAVADDYSCLSPYLCVHPAMDGRTYSQHVTYRPSLTRGELHCTGRRSVDRPGNWLPLRVRSRIELLAAPSRRIADLSGRRTEQNRTGGAQRPAAVEE